MACRSRQGDDHRGEAAAAAEKAAQADKDLAEKRKPYDADPIFSYLWKRGYGTSAYRAGFLARYFDAKLAKLVDYDKARPNYYMLTEIPVRLRDHATRQHEAIAAAKSDLVALERKALEADGIAPLEAKAAATDDARKAFAAELDGMKAELATLDKEQAALLDPAGDHSSRRRSMGSLRRLPARISPRFTRRRSRPRRRRTSGSSPRSARSSRRFSGARRGRGSPQDRRRARQETGGTRGVAIELPPRGL